MRNTQATKTGLRHMESRRDRIKSISTLLDIVESLHEEDGARITELSAHLDLSKSTVHRHLHSLRDRGYVIQQDEKYYLSLKFLELGTYVQTRRDEFQEARPIVKELAETTGERVQFHVEERGFMVCIHRVNGERAVISRSGAGKHGLMHATASGKAVLSKLSDEEVRKLLLGSGQSLEAVTENTITDIDVFLKELEQVRKMGYRLNDEETYPGLRAIGVSVTHSEKGVVGALTISAPANRLKGDNLDEYVRTLQGAANELQLNIEY